MSIPSNFGLRCDGALNSDYFGSSVAVGDINGDGIPDLIVGAPNASTQGLANNGCVYVIYGPLPQGSGSIQDINAPSNFNLRIDGASANDHFGRTLATGDLNGDGQADLAVTQDNPSTSSSVYIFYGGPANFPAGTGNIRAISGPTTYSLNFIPAAAGDDLGYTLLIADTNGDGKPDLIMGAPNASNNNTSTGSVYVVNGGAAPFTNLSTTYGMASTSNFNIRFDGAVAGERLGYSLAVGDLNQDGKPDLAMGSYNGVASSKGSVYVVYGNTPSDTGHTVDFRTSSNYAVRYDGGANENLGGGSLAIGDFNHDGRQDLAMGATGAGYNSQPTSGSVYVVYGGFPGGPGLTSDLTQAANFNVRFDGAVTGEYMGRVVQAGDLNNDGISDLIMGSQNVSSNHGALYVINGGGLLFPSGTGNILNLSNSANFNTRYDGPAGSHFGYCALISDLNGDGKADLVTGDAFANTQGRTYNGAVYVEYYSGPANASQGTTFIYPSPVKGDRAQIAYNMACSGNVKILVYNSIGNLVDKIEEHKSSNGVTENSLLSTHTFAPGVYYYLVRFTYDNGTSENLKPMKFVVVK